MAAGKLAEHVSPRASQPAARTRRRYAPRMAPGERREQLMDAAHRVIIEQGYAGVSIEAIARTAGVTRPVVYDHFANLGALVQALIEREERDALSQLDSVVPGIGSAPGDLATLITTVLRRFLEVVVSRPDNWRLILLPLAGTPKIVREHVETNRAIIRKRIEDLVRWSLGGNASAEWLDGELAAWAIMALAEEAGRQALTDPERFSPGRYEAFAATIIERVGLGSATRAASC